MPTLGFRSFLLVMSSAVAMQPACGDDDGNGRPGAEESSGTMGGDSTTSSPTEDGGPTDGTSNTDDGDGSGTGSDGPTSSGPDDSAGDESTETGAPPACDTETHACVGQPDGWTGPVAIVEAPTEEAPPTCDSLTYPEVVLDRNTGLVAPAADCECSCAASTDAECANSVTLNYYGTGMTCDGAPLQSYVFFPGVCNIVNPPIPAGGRVVAPPVPVVSGTCEPSVTQVVDEATFTARVLACGGAQLQDEGCSNGRVCAPQAPQGADLCVWQDGEHECPAEYPTRRLSFAGMEDTRACSACTCGTAQGLCDDATITLRAASATPCQGALNRVVTATEECLTTASSTSANAAVSLGEPTAFCDPSGGEPTGEAVGTDPVTVCCLDAAE